MITQYEKNDVYEEKIKSIMSKIEIICMREKMPFIFSIATENSEEGTTYKTNIYSPPSLGVDLTDDRITSCLQIISGGYKAFPDTSPDILIPASEEECFELPEDHVLR